MSLRVTISQLSVLKRVTLVVNEHVVSFCVVDVGSEVFLSISVLQTLRIIQDDNIYELDPFISIIPKDGVLELLSPQVYV